ncbi:hypothetical protein [Oceanicoccus sagamiensis]|uniref:PEP-CTERM protein-sorting domain-containing protein n=1 Tax=Oceanicoccus sagamiensis TaxID=716816 RepID=A0A1X9NLR6_9GAMM|nr:hypothetical protein [Oceanicoccus sagamiensis]ARN74883.1 hypothetical protein BST96_12620 [Oceanicoccus sagamiensis]
MLKNTLVLVGLTLSLSVKAAFIDLGNITLDTNTSLEWLDVTETAGRSYNDVFTEINSTSGLGKQGWRYATTSEFHTLVSNWFRRNYSGGRSYTIGTDEEIESFIKLFGDTQDWYYDNSTDPNVYQFDIPSYAAGRTRGILGDTFGFGQQMGLVSDMEIYYRAAPHRNTLHFDSNDSIDDEGSIGKYWTTTYPSSNSATNAFGSYLVRTTEIPLPPSAVLFTSAIAGLILKKRRSLGLSSIKTVVE